MWTKTGPNDASGVVWAQVSFFFSSSYYLILTNVLFYIQVVSMMYTNGRGLEDMELHCPGARPGWVKAIFSGP